MLDRPDELSADTPPEPLEESRARRSAIDSLVLPILLCGPRTADLIDRGGNGPTEPEPEQPTPEKK